MGYQKPHDGILGLNLWHLQPFNFMLANLDAVHLQTLSSQLDYLIVQTLLLCRKKNDFQKNLFLRFIFKIGRVSECITITIEFWLIGILEIESTATSSVFSVSELKVEPKRKLKRNVVIPTQYYLQCCTQTSA